MIMTRAATRVLTFTNMIHPFTPGQYFKDSIWFGSLQRYHSNMRDYIMDLTIDNVNQDNGIPERESLSEVMTRGRPR